MNYRATKDASGVLTIHDVPIFVECKRGEASFDLDWIMSAVKKAKQSEAEGYFPPLHVRHHGDGDVRPAGFFRITTASQIVFKGTRKLAVFADLVVTDPLVGMEILEKRLPYRSVEIFNRDVPSIDSLALLDHEAPYLELPMLMVSGVDEAQSGARIVASATIANPWLARESQTDSPMVACFRRGQTAHILFQDDDTMTTTTKTKKAEPEFGAGVQFEADGDKDTPPKDKKDGEDMEGEPAMDIKSIVKAIESGSISVADMDAILAAIASQRSEAGPEEDDTPAPAAVPGGESMKADDDLMVKFAALSGENEALKARLDAKDAAEARAKAVSVAMRRLEGRPLGADLEARLVKFHADHGAEAFKVHVDAMAQAAGVPPTKDDGVEGLFHGGKVPDVVMKYQSQGVDAMDRAAQFAKEWERLQGTGFSIPRDRYVEHSMTRLLARKGGDQ